MVPGCRKRENEEEPQGVETIGLPKGSGESGRGRGRGEEGKRIVAKGAVVGRWEGRRGKWRQSEKRSERRIAGRTRCLWGYVLRGKCKSADNRICITSGRGNLQFNAGGKESLKRQSTVPFHPPPLRVSISRYSLILRI